MKGFRTQHFGLRHMVVAYLSNSLFRNYTYTIQHGLARGMRRKGGLGFLPIQTTETPETRFLSQLPLEGKVVYDIGAFEGVLSLFFAQKARQVIAYEPNPRNYERCLANIRLNRLDNVQVMNRGVSDAPGTVHFAYDPLMPGAGSGNTALVEQIGVTVKSAQRLQITVLTLDEDIAEHHLSPPDLIKIDIEGMELSALRGMRRTLTDHRPFLFIEMHGASPKEKISNAQAVIGLLENQKYSLFDVEGGRDISLATLVTPPGHLYCTPL